MKNVYVYPYKIGSRSAADLARKLGSPQIKHKGSKFVGSSDKVVVNWGASELPDRVARASILNRPEFVKQAGNKLRFFQSISHLSDGPNYPGENLIVPRVVPWTTVNHVAQIWLNDGHTVVVRKTLTGHSGAGIVIVAGSEELPDAPLYTRYVPKDAEFRVHVIGDEIVDVQKKIRDPDQQPTTWKVRSHDNGFMFVREGFETPPDVLEQSRRAFYLSGLDFGAVDVVWNRKKQQAYILEVNCAPGLEGQTVQTYAEGLTKLIESIRNEQIQ